MDDKQTRALKRLAKKLSALRQTLTKSERALLDTLIIGAPAKVAGAKVAVAVQSVEVEGHAMHDAKVVDAKVAGAKIAGWHVIFNTATDSYQVVD